VTGLCAPSSEGDALAVDCLRLRDPTSVASSRSTTRGGRPALVVRALKVGLLALAGASTTIHIDDVQLRCDQLFRRIGADKGHLTR
jgi:hypothetical protein